MHIVLRSRIQPELAGLPNATFESISVSRQSITGSLNTSKCNISYDDEGDSWMKIQIGQRAQEIFHLHLFHLYKYPFDLWSLIFFIGIRAVFLYRGVTVIT